MCKECEVKQYESFDELPQELKDKFKSPATTKGNVKQSQKAFLRLINLLNKNNDELMSDYISNSTTILIKYSKCGHLPPKGIVPSNYFKGERCAVCCGNQVQKGVNDFGSTYPHLVHYFVNENDAYNYSKSSSKKVMMKCPQCGFEKLKIISSLPVQGLGCNRCGDGISYPEKVISNLFDELNINVKAQFVFDQYQKKYRYDFYLIDLDIIVEVHGGQHYTDKTKKSFLKTYEVEHENDMIKYDLAVLNGYEFNKNYFIIDARESNIEWIKNSVKNCRLFYNFELNNVDWKNIDIKSQKSLKVEVCKYWKSHKGLDIEFTTDLIEIFNISRTTIIQYLKWGNKYGICHYDSSEEKRKNDAKNSVFIYLINPHGEKWFDEPMSQIELTRKTGINSSSMKNYNTALKGVHSKYDEKYIGSYVVLADEWDNNKEQVWSKCTMKRQSAYSKYYFINSSNEKWFNEKMSFKEISKMTDINDSTIGNSFKYGRKIGVSSMATSFKFDEKYIGSYVVDAEEWDKLHDNKEA